MSIVIPCYNYARFLEQAVGSALDQSDVIVDVIVVDDASTDDSLRVARALAARDPRVRVLGNDQNRGAVATFNRGLAAATGEFLVRLDADDLLVPGALARAVAVMQHLPRVGLVYGHPLHFEGDELPVPRTKVRDWTTWSGADWLAARCLAGTNVITSPEVVMRRSVVDLVGGQRPLAHAHDMEMWLRIAAHSDVAYINGADQAWHRDHPASLSLKAADPLVILGEIRDAFDMLLDGLGGAADPQLRSRARRAVARQALDQAARAVDRGQRDASSQALLDFARACDPGVTGTALWRRLVAPDPADGLGRSLRRVSGALARVGRRMRFERAQRRWHRTGIYEPVILSSS